MFRLLRTAVEGFALANARCTFGDEQVADWVFEQDYDPGFVSRHPNQLGSLYEEKFFPDEY